MAEVCATCAQALTTQIDIQWDTSTYSDPTQFFINIESYEFTLPPLILAPDYCFVVDFVTSDSQVSCETATRLCTITPVLIEGPTQFSFTVVAKINDAVSQPYAFDIQFRCHATSSSIDLSEFEVAVQSYQDMILMYKVEDPPYFPNFPSIRASHFYLPSLGCP